MKKVKTIKNIVAFLLITAVLFAMSACNGQPKNENKNTVVFTDALGREVNIKKNPERVAALLGSFADVWMLAGGKLCASADDAWEDFGLELDDAVNIAYGAFRFLIEYVRGDDRGELVGFISPSQFWSIFMVLIGIATAILMNYLLKKVAKNEKTS